MMCALGHFLIGEWHLVKSMSIYKQFQELRYRIKCTCRKASIVIMQTSTGYNPFSSDHGQPREQRAIPFDSYRGDVGK